MLKNVLAAIGLFTVCQQGYELYRRYDKLKQEKEYWQRRCQEAASDPAAPAA